MSPSSTPSSASFSNSASNKVNREDLLLSLSDGEMLCLSYNSILRRSRRPWGFIPNKDIHFLSREMHQEQLNAKKDWTFRRLENLRVWSAALRLRYNIHCSSLNDSRKGGVNFDPKTVARKEVGWAEMLEELVKRWMNEVVGESRDEGVE